MRFRWILAVLVLVGGLAVAGCGGDDDDDGEATAGDGGAGQELSGDPIEVGVVGPTGSPQVNIPFSIASVRAAARGINEDGGINGRPVEVVYCNDQGDPNQTEACGREMIEEEVVMVTGGGLLSGGTVLTPMLAQAGIPQVGIEAISPEEYSNPNVFLFGTGGQGVSVINAALATAHDVPTSLVASDNPTATPLIEGLRETMAANGNEFTTEVLVAPDQADFGPVTAASEAEGSEAALVFTGGEQGVQYLQTAFAEGTELNFLTPYYWTEEDAEDFGGPEQLDRFVTAEQFQPLDSDNPVVQQFIEDMERQAASGDEEAELYSTTQATSVTGTWAAVWAMERIIEQQGLEEITAETFKSALESTDSLDMEGLMPDWQPNAEGPPETPRAANDRYFVVGWENGEPVQLADEAVNVQDILGGATADVQLFGEY